MLFGGKKSRKSKSRSRSCEFYSVYTRKKVRVANKDCCLRRIVMPHGRGIRYQLYAKKGDQKLYKFISAEEANKYKDCKGKKTVVKSRKSKKSKKSRKTKKSRASRKSHKAHSHKHKRSSKLRKYGRKKSKKHSHKHSHKKGKSRKGSRHSHRH